MVDVRNKVMELVEIGVLDSNNLLLMCLKYMSTDEVEEMLRINDIDINEYFI